MFAFTYFVEVEVAIYILMIFQSCGELNNTTLFVALWKLNFMRLDVMSCNYYV